MHDVLSGAIRARLNSALELGLLDHRILEIVVELIGVVLNADILWVPLSWGVLV